jgi:hypothetical protein
MNFEVANVIVKTSVFHVANYADRSELKGHRAHPVHAVAFQQSSGF